MWQSAVGSTRLGRWEGQGRYPADRGPSWVQERSPGGDLAVKPPDAETFLYNVTIITENNISLSVTGTERKQFDQCLAALYPYSTPEKS